MTREEAIKILKRDNPNNITIRDGYEKLFDDRKEAFGMAIKALEQEPCDDCVSRADAIKKVSEILKNVFVEYEDIAQKAIGSLPLVTPQPKTGHWISGHKETGALGITYTEKICSNCGWNHSLVIPKNYCPNCGAEMVGSEGI